MRDSTLFVCTGLSAIRTLTQNIQNKKLEQCYFCNLLHFTRSPCDAEKSLFCFKLFMEMSECIISTHYSEIGQQKKERKIIYLQNKCSYEGLFKR